MKLSYVKEVSDVIDTGEVTADQAIALYDRLTDAFQRIFGVVEAEDLQAEVKAMRKYERREYHEVIDDVSEIVGLTWREVSFKEQRIKRCEVCQAWFYDYSRNGRKLTCDTQGEYMRYDLKNRKYKYRYKHGKKLSECAALYEQERAAESAVEQGRERRNVQEVLYDPMPADNDRQGNAIMKKVEEMVQRNRKLG